MIYFLTDCTFCKDSGIFSIVYLIKQAMQVVFLIIPIILIVLVLIDIAKNVIAGKEDDMKKNKNLAIRRIIYAVVIFFIPTIVNIFMRVMYNVVDGSSEQSFLQCWTNADDISKVNRCNSESIANEIAADMLKQLESNEKINKYKEEVKNNTTGGGLGAKQEQTNNDNNSNSTDNTNSNLPSTINNYTIYTGDSRTNLMCYYTNLAPLGGGSTNSNEKCLVAPGKAYTYFNKTMSKELEKELQTHSDANIVLASWGTNDISPNIYPNNKNLKFAGTTNAKYYSTAYKELAKKYPNAKFVVVSILYYDESKHGAITYRLTNDLVDNFNSNMKSFVKGQSNIVYCDITSTLGTTLNSPDGIHHYGSENNQKILDEIKKCI